MKVSKRQLRKIIKEEKRKVLELHDPLDPFSDDNWREQAVLEAWPLVQAALEQAMDLGALELPAVQKLEGIIQSMMDPEGDWLP